LSSADIWDWGSDVILDTSIRNDKDCILTDEGILINIIKFVMIYDSYIGIFLINWMKIKTIMKSVYKMKAKSVFSLILWEANIVILSWNTKAKNYIEW